MLAHHGIKPEIFEISDCGIGLKRLLAGSNRLSSLPSPKWAVLRILSRRSGSVMSGVTSMSPPTQ